MRSRSTGCRRLLIGAIILTCVFRMEALSQKQIEEAEQTWIGYFNVTRFSDRSGMWVDLHYRLTDHFIRQKTFVIGRAAYVYHINDQLRLMAGYAYANRYNQAGVSRIPEHRPWQLLQWIDKKKRLTLTQGFRVEQRFRKAAEGKGAAQNYHFNWRMRYNVSIAISLTAREIEPQTAFLVINNELHINAGKKIVHNYFDQNRFFVGLGYQFTPALSAQIGNLFIFQHTGMPASYLHIHGIRFNVLHNIDFRSGD